VLGFCIDLILSNDQSRQQLRWLRDKEQEITQRVGQEPEFLEKENVRRRRVSVTANENILSEPDRIKALQWMLGKLLQMLDLFRPMIPALQQVGSDD
jgi:hypothetical protein